MKRNFTFRSLLAAGLAIAASHEVKAQAFTQNFDDITTLSAAGWYQQNNSTPAGTNPVWFQGTSVAAGGPFDSYNGAANAYVACNYNSVAGNNTISNWLLTPNITLRNGDVLTFYTRKDAPDQYPDRLEVRMSTNGASTNVGSGATGIGDFTTLLLSVNPTLVTGVYPTTWTLYTVNVTGLAAPTSGRFAFRYFVTSGGPTGTNSDYIGVDNVVYTPYVCPTVNVTPSSLSGATAGTAYSQSVSSTGTLGATSYSITAGALPAGLTLSASGTISGTPTVTGTFNFTVSASDASGCTGSTAYTLTVACPSYTFGGSFTDGTAGASYSYTPPISGGIGTMTYAVSSGALPPGLTLNPSTGEVSGTPTATGSYSFGISATDANSCTGAAGYSIVVNCPTGVASLSLPQSVFCSNDGIATLSGGAPAGGVYSGTGVSGTDFDPSTGSQTIQYTYIDTYGCTQVASENVTVNTAPTVSGMASAATLCEGASETLTGSGADTYTWDNGVSDGLSFPANTATTMYTVTGTVTATGCSSTSSVTITVNANPAVTPTSDAPANTICEGGMVTLNGSGADSYTWDNGVSDGVAFTATATTMYTVIGTSTATGCADTASITITVNPLPLVDLTVTPAIVCQSGGAVTLGGGTPAGGSFSGSGVTGGTFDPTSMSPGNYTITYSYTDANGCAASDTSGIMVSLCTGVESLAMNDNVLVYPNPSNGAFTVVYSNASHADLVIRITDIQGKAVAAEAVNNFSGTYTNTFDLGSYGKGIYLLEIKANGMVTHRKIVLQ